ncbi:MAG: MFS transporter [Granulosicoccus sp.]
MQDVNRPGVRAVVAYLLGTSFFFYAFVQRVSPSVMTEELMRDFAIGGAGIGLLSGVYFYTYALIQLPVGLLIDRVGARKLMSLALVVCALCCVGFALSESLISASVSRALIGASVAFSFVGTLSIASLFFPPSRFAMLAGILLAVGMCGAIAGQAPLRLLMDGVGWRNTFKVLGFVALLQAILIYIAVPKRPVGSTKVGNVDSIWLGLSAVLVNRQSWCCAIAGYGLSATMLSFAGLWAVPWLSSTHDIDKTQAAFIASAMFAGWAVGSPAAGWFSDAIGRRKPVLIGGALVAIMTLTIIIHVNVQRPVFLALLFFINGLGCCSMVVCFGLVKEWNPSKNTASAVGFTNMWIVASGAVMQPLIGWLLDKQWSGETINDVRIYSPEAYQLALSSLIVLSLVALIASMLVGETHCKPQID